MAENDETTKLVIYGLGIGTLLFFAYLIYRDVIQGQSRQDIQRKYGFMASDRENSGLEQIEQKLLQLESKIDNFTKSNAPIQLHNQSLQNQYVPSQFIPNQSISNQSISNQPERKTVSMTPKIKSLSTENKQSHAEDYGML